MKTQEQLIAESLPSRAIQIQTVQHPGDSNCGPHSMLFALLESGAIYVRYFSSGYSNVPTDGKWHQLECEQIGPNGVMGFDI